MYGITSKAQWEDKERDKVVVYVIKNGKKWYEYPEELISDLAEVLGPPNDLSPYVVVSYDGLGGTPVPGGLGVSKNHLEMAGYFGGGIGMASETVDTILPQVREE